MFGYIRPYKPELKIKHYTLYKAFYCGLCEALQVQYGFSARFILSYDCTFAAALLTYASGSKGDYCKLGRCKLKPLAQKVSIAKESPALDFAAALNVILTYYNFEDDVLDDNSVFAKLGRFMLSKPRRTAKSMYPELDIVIANGLAELRRIEKSGVDLIDAPANAFADMLANSLICFPKLSAQNVTILHELMFNIGRFIYIADAWNDREKDKLSHSYNPFLMNKRYDMHVAELLLDVAATQASHAFDLLSGCADSYVFDLHSLLENIVNDGTIQTEKAVIDDKYVKSPR